jgi:hypothetical protein
MPPVEIRGFAFHGESLVIATFGRSFWVMDDMSPLRQVTATMSDAAVVLYKPEPADLHAGSARVYGGNDPSKEAADLDPMLVISADAPPSGAVIYYYLRADSGPVSLDILNSAGQVVGHYSSTQRVSPQNPNNMTVAAVFARTPVILSAAAGLHAWTWDLRKVKPGADTGGQGSSFAFFRGGAGNPAAPGMYTVRLMAGGHRYTQPLVVKLAPGMTYSAQAMQEQQQLAGEIRALQTQVSGALREAGQLRAKLVKLESSASGNQSLAASISALSDKAHAIEGFASEPPNPDASGEGDASPAPTSLTGLVRILGQLSGSAQNGLDAPRAEFIWFFPLNGSFRLTRRTPGWHACRRELARILPLISRLEFFHSKSSRRREGGCRPSREICSYNPLVFSYCIVLVSARRLT